MFAIVILLSILCLLGAAGINVLNAHAHQNAIRDGRVRESPETTSAKLRTFRLWALACCLSAGVVAVIGVAVNPYVRVWTHGMEGQAQMAQAEASRQIKVREAQATRDAALLLAEAEVARAKGVAEANRIVADGLGGPEGYLRYLYIEGLKEAREKGNAQVIYVATEAGLPILESTRLNHSGSKQ